MVVTDARRSNFNKFGDLSFKDSVYGLFTLSVQWLLIREWCSVVSVVLCCRFGCCVPNVVGGFLYLLVLRCGSNCGERGVIVSIDMRWVL